MRLLVTGGCGFIGSNFIRYWLESNPKDFIINLDKLTYAGHLSSTKDFKENPHYTFIKGDITNPKEVKKAIEGVDIVVHFAAESHVDRSILEPATFLKTNVLGTQVLLEAAMNEKVKRFHHVSTDEVYGALSLETKEKFSEETPYSPRSPYAASKASSDHIVRAYFHTFGLPVSITNCSNNYGPFQDTEKFIPRMITNLVEGKNIMIYGDGKYVRDWLFVVDHCRAIEAVIKKGKEGETYIVGGQLDETNNLEIAKEILNAFDMDESKLTFVKDRKGHDRRYAVDWRKIKNELGWKPIYNFEEGINKTVEWYRQNKWWWKKTIKASEKLHAQTGQK